MSNINLLIWMLMDFLSYTFIFLIGVSMPWIISFCVYNFSEIFIFSKRATKKSLIKSLFYTVVITVFVAILSVWFALNMPLSTITGVLAYFAIIFSSEHDLFKTKELLHTTIINFKRILNRQN